MLNRSARRGAQRSMRGASGADNTASRELQTVHGCRHHEPAIGHLLLPSQANQVVPDGVSHSEGSSADQCLHSLHQVCGQTRSPTLFPGAGHQRTPGWFSARCSENPSKCHTKTDASDRATLSGQGQWET